ncbi:radical SAM protein [Thermococcus sp.]|uniref:radical SAM protein n=1 Tax=Thermococcus sp. TaxID=35749 RepID=UPI002634A1D2|nr:radical SAM protein [Thermococcus sp.]
MLIRVSYGTALSMGLLSGRMLARPTTAYLMTYHDGRCRNNCGFCPQARESRADLKKLSRVTWPAFELEDVIGHMIEGGFGRICIQTVDYPGMVEDVLTILEDLRPLGLPVSLSITPVDREVLLRFRALGVDYIGIGLDVASEGLYGIIKDSAYSWGEMWRFTRDVLEVFGGGRAVVHVIVGLGETDKEIVTTLEEVYGLGGEVSLFAFTPVKGTRLESLSPPSMVRYRRIQLAHYLIRKNLPRKFEFDGAGNLKGFGVGADELRRVVSPEVFATYGCPACNRPYYNEKPSSEPYNFPVVPKQGYLKEQLKLILGGR